jgi:hypothetical protein
LVKRKARDYIPIPKNKIEHDDAPDMIAAAVENLDPQYGSGRTEVYVL